MTTMLPIALVLLAAVTPAAPNAIETRTAQVTVQIDGAKPNGKAWDAWGGAPDPALCVVTNLGTRCYPGGTSVAGITSPQCSDTFTCRFAVEVPASGPFDLAVVDVDAVVNDAVGSGSCDVGHSCRLGYSDAVDAVTLAHASDRTASTSRSHRRRTTAMPSFHPPQSIDAASECAEAMLARGEDLASFRFGRAGGALWVSTDRTKVVGDLVLDVRGVPVYVGLTAGRASNSPVDSAPPRRSGQDPGD